MDFPYTFFNSILKTILKVLVSKYFPSGNLLKTRISGGEPAGLV
jgi:hypothetical protein